MVDAGTVQAIEFTLNGERVKATVESRQLLVHFLRDTLGLKGTHVGCDTGSCGACSLIVNGKLIKSCMMLAPQADGCEIETIEGVARNGQLTPVQQAFHEEHGLQCGFCTPAMMLVGSALLARNPDPTEEEVRWAISGNLCRCTGYQNIVKAIRAAGAASRAGAPA